MAAPIAIRAQVLGTGSDGTSPSILFTIERHGIYSQDVTILKRYLFNCGEETQRLCNEHHIKWSSLDTLYISRFNNENIAGVPGLIFALGSHGSGKLDIYGPPKTSDFITSLESFVSRRYPQIACHEFPIQVCSQYNTLCISDNHSHIFPMYLAQNEATSASDTTPCYFCVHQTTDGKEQQKEKTVCLKVTKKIKNWDFASESISVSWLEAFYERYQSDKVLHAEKILRQFAGREAQLKEMLFSKYIIKSDRNCVKKLKVGFSAVEYNVAASTCNRKAKSSGLIEKFAEVEVPEAKSLNLDVNKEEPPLCYAIKFLHGEVTAFVITCPSIGHISSLSRQFKPCSHHAPRLIVHITPTSVFRHPEYVSWIGNHKTSEHLVFDGNALDSVDHGVFSYCFRASAEDALARRSNTNNIRWERLSCYLASQNLSQTHLMIRPSDSSSSAHLAQTQLSYLLYHTGGDDSFFDYTKTKWKPVRDISRTLHQQVQETKHEKITFLGTGCAAPSKYRASSGIYLELCTVQRAGILLDCGEGTLGHFYRCFGKIEAHYRISQLSLIWISHHHADHQCGILSVLNAFASYHAKRIEAEATLSVIAPQKVLQYIQTWMQDFVLYKKLPGIRIQTQTCRNSNDRAEPLWSEIMKNCKPNQRYTVSKIYSVPVHHCHDAYGIVITFRNGTKLVYSGDTTPCKALVRAGMNADLLIHEATFDDSRWEDAHRKRHSTVSQALAIGLEMSARRIVLTHLSARYPVSLLHAQTKDIHYTIAFDGYAIGMP